MDTLAASTDSNCQRREMECREYTGRSAALARERFFRIDESAAKTPHGCEAIMAMIHVCAGLFVSSRVI
jgi:hypothetical protein